MGCWNGSCKLSGLPITYGTECLYEDAEYTFKALADLAHVQSLMGLLRKSWAPESGAGSQSAEWGLYERFNQKVIEIARKEREAEESDDD